MLDEVYQVAGLPLESKSDFLKLISHEFRIPLNGLLGVGEPWLAGSKDNETRSQLRIGIRPECPEYQ